MECFGVKKLLKLVSRYRNDKISKRFVVVLYEVESCAESERISSWKFISIQKRPKFTKQSFLLLFAHISNLVPMIISYVYKCYDCCGSSPSVHEQVLLLLFHNVFKIASFHLVLLNIQRCLIFRGALLALRDEITVVYRLGEERIVCFKNIYHLSFFIFSYFFCFLSYFFLPLYFPSFSLVCIGNSMICSDIWHKYHE